MTLSPVPPLPPVPVRGVDDCLRGAPSEAANNGTLECQYFTSGSAVPASVPHGQGLSSGDYAVRFSIVGGSPMLTLRIPCASYAVRVSIVGQTITPDPGTFESFVGTCTFPWDKDQERMTRYLRAPMQFERRDNGIVLHNPEWGVTLLRTPYEAY